MKPTFRRLVTSLGHEVVTTQELGQTAATDAEQLVTATGLGRILVTHNGKDYRTLCQAWHVWRRLRQLDPADHAGVVATPQQTLLSCEEAARHIDRLLVRQQDIRSQLWYFDLRAADWVRQV